MLTITERIPDFAAYEEYLGYRRGTALFFDIETTGLSPASSIVFLIGAMLWSGDSWQLTQWLAQTPEDEPLLLQAFFDAATGCDTLIHFNGTTFDLPFVRERARLLRLACSLEIRNSLDLYQRFRPLKASLGLARMNQTTLERFLGWPRRDRLSGKQMISLFQKYAVSQELKLADLLLLHNHDDLTGMTELLRLSAYSILFQGQFATVRASIESKAIYEGTTSDAQIHPVARHGANSENRSGSGENADIIRNSHVCMRLHLTLKAALPQELTLSAPFASPRSGSCRTADASAAAHQNESPHLNSSFNPRSDLYYTLTASGTRAILSVPGFWGELRHFFPNYRDYYYLPLEDQAVHKSVAAFVDPQYRIRATPSNCYIKKSGLFFPQPEESFLPAFKLSCESKDLFFSLPEQETPLRPKPESEQDAQQNLDQEMLAAYAASLLRKIAQNAGIRPLPV